MQQYINSIIKNDCFKIFPYIPVSSINLVIADAPYYLLDKDWDNQWADQAKYLIWCYKWFHEVWRVLIYDGSFYCFQDWRLVAEFAIKLKEMFHLHNWVTWERNKGRSSTRNFKSSKEEILIFSKSKNPKFNAQEKLRPVIAPYKDDEGKPKGWYIDEEGNRVRWTGVSNVWHYTPPVWSSIEDAPIHPCQKPLAMYERIIEASTNENDIVLDPFSGSGTTAIACKKLNRRFICIESDKNYYEASLKRLENYGNNV